jgi:acetylornithine deacetylase/succinyl-diaminopimelate desuccinylase-like protein
MAELDVLEVRSTLVRLDTTNRGHGDAEGERAAADYVAQLLADAGIEAKIIESGSRARERHRPGRGQRSVVARAAGSRPPRRRPGRGE